MDLLKITNVGKLSRYAMISRRMLLDSIGRFWPVVLLSVFCAGMGIVLQLSAVSIGVKYASYLKSGNLIEKFGFYVVPRESIALLAVVAGVVFVLWLLNAFSTFTSDNIALKLQRRYEEYCANRVLNHVSSTVPFSNLNKDTGSVAPLVRLICGDAKICGLSFRLSIKIFIPAITFFCATIFLFYLNWLLTLALFFPVLIFTFVIYRINIWASRSSAQLESSSSVYRSIFNNFLKSIQGNPSKQAGVDFLSSEELFQNEKVKFSLEAYYNRLLSIETSTLATNLLSSISFLFILTLMGMSMIKSNSGWNELVIYLVALHYSLTSLRTVSRIFTSVNRFYPVVGRYFDFLQMSEKNDEDDKWLSKLLRVNFRGGHYCLSAGQRAALYHTVPANRYSARALISQLFCFEEDEKSPSIGDIGFVLPNYSFTIPQSVRAAFGFPVSHESEKIMQEIKQAGMGEKFSEWAKNKDFDEVISANHWKTLPQELASFLAYLGNIFLEKKILFLRFEALNEIPSETLQWLFDQSKNCYLLIFYKDFLDQEPGQFDETLVIVGDSHKLRWVGEPQMFPRQISTLKKYLRPEFEEEEADDLTLIEI